MISEAKEIVRALEKLIKELKAIRKVLESWDEDPKIDEDNTEKYIL